MENNRDGKFTGRYIIGRADREVKGYTPEKQFGTFHNWDAAEKKAADLNETLGLTPIEAVSIVLSTMTFTR